MEDISRQDDLALLRRYCGTGDPSAFSAIVGRNATMVFATARRVTGDAATAEDVAQDCFLKLAQGARQVSGSVAAWLHRTSVNRALELRRSDHARRRREVIATQQRDSAPEDASRLIAHVDVALSALPDELRFVLTEHFLCGKTQSELAVLMGVNQSTIQRRIQKGVEELRRKLDEEEKTSPALLLPVFLQQLASPAVPESLRQSLIKIGLSNAGSSGSVAAGSMAKAGSLVVAKNVSASMIVCGLLIAGGAGLALRSALSDRIAPAATIARAQLPAAVRKTLGGIATAGAIYGEIERKHDGKLLVYDIDVTINGKRHELRIADDGTLIFNKP